MISARDHLWLSVELPTTDRSGCVWQLLMMLMQERLVSAHVLLLLLLLAVNAVSCSQRSTNKVHLRLELVVMGHHQWLMLVLRNSSSHCMIDLVGSHRIPS